MLLYIHVPFCQQKCAYCAFYSLPLDTATNTFLRQNPSANPSKGCFPAQPSPAAQLPPCPIAQTETNPLLELYCQTLEAEIALRASLVNGLEGQHTQPPASRLATHLANNPTSHHVTSIFFGGGTPSLLSSHQVERILSTLHRHFSLASQIEITMEANPESASRPHWLSEIRQAGVNRLSLGVQSFHHDELLLLGRKHKVADVEKTVNLAHQACFSSISLDLMWGIPRLAQGVSSGATPLSASDHSCSLPCSHPSVQSSSQSNAHVSASITPCSTQNPSLAFTDRWLSNLESALALSPHHISAYGLILEEGTPLAQKLKENKTSFQFPTEEDELTMYKEGIKLLQRHGFKQYEISNYAQHGHQCQHNLGYWQGINYYGFGPSAVSTLSTTRFANTSDFASWLTGVTNGSPEGEEEALTPHMLQEEKVMLSLRMTEGLAADDWNTVSPTPLHTLPLVQQLLAEKLATFDNCHLALTPSGMMVSNAIISRLFESISS